MQMGFSKCPALKKFLDDFQNATVLVTIRDPRANLKSGLLNWFKYDYRRKHMEHVYIYLRRIRDDLNYIFNVLPWCNIIEFV